MSKHKTPSEHYWYAEDLLAKCEDLRLSLRDESLTEEEYDATVTAISVYLQAGAIAAALAGAPDPGEKPTRP